LKSNCHLPVLIFWKRLDGSLLLQKIVEKFPFFLRAIADVDSVRLADLGVLFDKVADLFRQLVQVAVQHIVIPTWPQTAGQFRRNGRLFEEVRGEPESKCNQLKYKKKSVHIG